MWTGSEVERRRMSEKKKQCYKGINRFLSICLDLADLYDDTGCEAYLNDNPTIEQGARYEHMNWTCSELGLGYRALTQYLRNGVKEIIKLQGEYRREKELRKYAKLSEKDARDYLEELFGDREPECINDKDRERIMKGMR
jgi:hypothetical protein